MAITSEEEEGNDYECTFGCMGVFEWKRNYDFFVREIPILPLVVVVDN